jgi:leucyl aminopeptidase (aminopeptidase T)
MPDSSGSLERQIARQVLTKTLRVRRGENVTIESWTEALPWAVPFVTEARRLGARPIMLYEDEPAFWEALATGASQATGQVGKHEWNALHETDAYVFFYGPSEWPRFDDLSPRQAAGVAAYNREWYRRAAKARLRGARMYLGRTSERAAERWKVDLRDWRDALLKASLADPTRMHQVGERIGRRLRAGKQVRITHENGTDLTFRLGGFPVQLDDGLVDENDLRVGNNMANIPGGVVGVAIDHTSAGGSAVGNHRVYPEDGTADGLRWTFEDGRLTERSFTEGASIFESEHSKAPKKGRDLLGYFSIGLNPQLSGCPQMEDQEIGSVLLRIGGNAFVGGKNPSPFAFWLVITGADVSIDDRPIVRNGAIV